VEAKKMPGVSVVDKLKLVGALLLPERKGTRINRLLVRGLVPLPSLVQLEVKKMVDIVKKMAVIVKKMVVIVKKMVVIVVDNLSLVGAMLLVASKGVTRITPTGRGRRQYPSTC
jgi:hypothetical protein